VIRFVATTEDLLHSRFALSPVSDLIRLSRVLSGKSRLIGASRARILLALDEPASTSQLARTLSIATGAVGDHLISLCRRNTWPSKKFRHAVRRHPPGQSFNRA
jgi:hypothetical protein